MHVKLTGILAVSQAAWAQETRHTHESSNWRIRVNRPSLGKNKWQRDFENLLNARNNDTLFDSDFLQQKIAEKTIREEVTAAEDYICNDYLNKPITQTEVEIILVLTVSGMK